MISEKKLFTQGIILVFRKIDRDLSSPREGVLTDMVDIKCIDGFIITVKTEHF